MKWGLRSFGILDLLTFLIFIPSKINYLSSTFQFAFSMNAKVDAIWQVIVLFLFLSTAILLWVKPIIGLFFSFVLVPFRVVFAYLSLEVLSFAAYKFGFGVFISSSFSQINWFYILFTFEALRYLYSFYAYYKLSD